MRRTPQFMLNQPIVFLPGFQKDSRRRAFEVPWSPAEDNLLKNCAEKYPANWRLIADTLNDSRVRSTVDKRTPFECFDRWRTRWAMNRAPGSSGNTADESGSSGAQNGAHQTSSAISDNASPQGHSSVTPTVSSPTTQMTTRGVKRNANAVAAAAAQNANNLALYTSQNNIEARKRKRHLIISDAMRKFSKKREAHLRQARKSYSFFGMHSLTRCFPRKYQKAGWSHSRHSCTVRNDCEEDANGIGSLEG